MLQACFSDVLPLVGALQVTVRTARPAQSDSATSRHLTSDKRVALRAMGEEWVVVQRAIAGDALAHEQLFARHAARQ